ncbi:MAG: hypothetical protein ISR91_05550 [Candidatus Delongbacteria bacterium]|nr:hypothetical protein [Candidatus Delongbacteria bacterium]
MTTTTHISTDKTLQQDIERLHYRKKLFLNRMERVLHQQSDIRHLVSIPINPRDSKVVLRDSEKSSRVHLVSGKRSSGFYIENLEMIEDVAEKMLARLWQMHTED